MSATTGAVVGSMVAIQAAQNERIEKQRCQMVLENYDPVYAETKGMKEYAYCVQKLYPEPMTHNENMVAKGCVIILLISLVIGVVWGYKQEDGWEVIALGAIMFPLLLIGGIIILGLVVMGVMFLFS